MAHIWPIFYNFDDHICQFCQAVTCQHCQPCVLLPLCSRRLPASRWRVRIGMAIHVRRHGWLRIAVSIVFRVYFLWTRLRTLCFLLPIFRKIRQKKYICQISLRYCNLMQSQYHSSKCLHFCKMPTNVRENCRTCADIWLLLTSGDIALDFSKCCKSVSTHDKHLK